MIAMLVARGGGIFAMNLPDGLPLDIERIVLDRDQLRGPDDFPAVREFVRLGLVEGYQVFPVFEEVEK